MGASRRVNTTSNLGVPEATEEGEQALLAQEGCEVLLQMMQVPVLAGSNKTMLGLTFFDSGSSMGLVREGFAKKLGLKGKNVVLIIQVVGQEWSRWETTQYTITMVDMHGRCTAWSPSHPLLREYSWMTLCTSFRTSDL